MGHTMRGDAAAAVADRLLWRLLGAGDWVPQEQVRNWLGRQATEVDAQRVGADLQGRGLAVFDAQLSSWRVCGGEAARRAGQLAVRDGRRNAMWQGRVGAQWLMGHCAIWRDGQGRLRVLMADAVTQADAAGPRLQAAVDRFFAVAQGLGPVAEVAGERSDGGGDVDG